MKCWGRNDEGDLGNGTTTHSSIPVTVLTPSSSSYSDPAHKHAVTSLSSGETYTYDANGNMITRVEGGLTYNQVYDAENRLISVTVNSQTTQFVYDGDGNMVKKINPDGSRTIYVGGIYEVDKASGGSVTRTVTYYPAGGAMRINSTLYFILKDHLGSASVVTNASGVTLGETRYYPYGETRLTTGSIFTDRLFTGQREMAGLGIYHYGARFFSPRLGRFLSADTMVPNLYNPQDLNRFSYVRNNPVRYTDPTGHYLYCDPYEDDCHDPDPAPAPTPAPSPCYTCEGGPNDDDDIDPNPNSYPGSPECYPGELVCYAQQDGYVDSAAETWSQAADYYEDNLTLAAQSAWAYFTSPVASIGQMFDPYFCQNCGQGIDYGAQMLEVIRGLISSVSNSPPRLTVTPFFSTPTPSVTTASSTPIPTSTITPQYTATVTSTITPTVTSTLTVTPSATQPPSPTWTSSFTPMSPYITPTSGR